MPLSDTYTTGCKWLGFSGIAVAIVGSKTLNELFPADDTEFDESVLLCCGSTSQYLNYGAYGEDGYLKKNSGTPSIVNGAAGHAITYLGACFIYGNSSDFEYINVSKRKTNTYDGYYGGSWDNVKNARFIIDCCNAGLYGGAPYSWDSFDYPSRKNSCYHFNGAYTKLQYQYSTSSGATSSSYAQSAASITGDNRKRILKGALNTYVTNYQPTMADTATLSSVEVTLVFAFNINGEIILAKNPDNIPLPLATGSKQYIVIEGVNQYLTIGDSCNTDNTNKLPDSDEKWSIWAFGQWDGGYWSNWWAAYYKTVNAVFYIYNSAGIRWLDYADAPSNAGQFRSNVNLGVMDSAGIIDHTQWLHGEDNIQSSDNPNKSGNYDNIPKHGGGGGGTDDDENTPVSTVGTPFGTGLAHYYVTTVDSTILSQISEAMSTWDIDATKKDLYRNLISCKLMKPPAGIPATPSVFEIYGVKPQYQGADIIINAVDGNPDIAFDAISIPRKFNDFRDYAPYSKAEIFIPYCGWTALPSHVIGRSVSVSYYADVIAGTVKAVIFCGNNVVAEAAGVMAVDIPFASQNVGSKVQAATTGLLSYGQGAFQAAVGIGQMVATKGQSGVKNLASGLAGVIGGTAQMAMTANENWTEINGKSGDGTCLAGVDTIIVKITRPKYGDYEAPYYVPAEFPHTVGFISMKKAKVGDCTGLIICDNVDTSGIAGATDRERQLIKNYLENGIIVEHPATP